MNMLGLCKLELNFILTYSFDLITLVLMYFLGFVSSFHFYSYFYFDCFCVFNLKMRIMIFFSFCYQRWHYLIDSVDSVMLLLLFDSVH